MSISLRTVLVIAAAALAVPMLGACTDDDPETTITGTASPSPTVVADVNHDTVIAGPFVKDFRAAWPKIAKGVADGDLADGAVEICDLTDDAKGDRDAIITEISQDFVHNGIKPDDKTVIAIMNLAVKDACPGHAGNLKAIL